MADAQIVVQGELQDKQIGIGQSTQIDISVHTSGDESVGEPKIPMLQGFRVQNTSQSTSVSTKMYPGENGMEYKSEKVVTYSIQILAIEAGRKTIPSIEIDVDGKSFKTQPLSIEVKKELVKSKHKSPLEEMFGEEDPFGTMDKMEEEMFNQILKRRGLMQPQNQGNTNDQQEGVNPGLLKEPAYRSMPTNGNEAFFIQVEVDKLEAYEGEQILVSWYLLTKGQLESLDRTKFPDLRGFWKEIIEEVPSIQFYQEIINGIPYRKALLARHALFPLKAGDAVIDEFKIKSKVRLPSQGFGGLQAKAYEYTKSSQRIKIKVKPIPTENRPANYTGAIGTYKISSLIEGDTPTAHQPMKFKLKIEGAGNAKGIELPSINWPEGIEVFEVKQDSRFQKNGQSYKEFEIILIPRKEGDVVLPPIELSYFDTSDKRFETIKTSEIPLKVLPGNPNSQISSYQTKQDKTVKATNELSPPILITDWTSYSSLSQNFKFISWIGLFAITLIFLIGFAYQQLGWGKKEFDHKRELEKRLGRIEKNMSPTANRGTFIEMTNTYYFALGAATNEGLSGVDIKKLLDQIPSSLRRIHEADIIETFEYFQTLAFAPEEVTRSLMTAEQLSKNFNKAKKVLISCISQKV